MTRVFVALACLADVLVGLAGALGFLGLDPFERAVAVGVSVAGVLFWRRYQEETAR